MNRSDAAAARPTATADAGRVEEPSETDTPKGKRLAPAAAVIQRVVRAPSETSGSGMNTASARARTSSVA
jgi:hypothetical protein